MYVPEGKIFLSIYFLSWETWKPILGGETDPKLNFYLALLSILLNDIDQWLSKYGLQIPGYSGDLFRGFPRQKHFIIIWEIICLFHLCWHLHSWCRSNVRWNCSPELQAGLGQTVAGILACACSNASANFA